MRQASNREMARSRPLFFVADSFADEVAHLIETVRLRLSYGDSIAVLFPQQRQFTDWPEDSGKRESMWRSNKGMRHWTFPSPDAEARDQPITRPRA